MPRQNLNVDGKIGGRKCRVRKRGCSSSSSSSLVQNYRLKRAFLVGKRGGSSTPVPVWKMMGSKSPSLENDKAALKPFLAAKNGEKPKESSVSARKLAATLWEINGLPSPRVKKEKNLEEKRNEIEIYRKERFLESSKQGTLAIHLSDPFHSPVSERMDPENVGSHRRRASAGSQKLLHGDDSLGRVNSLQNCLVEVDPIQNHALSPCRQVVGSKNRLKDIYNGLTTSKELLKVMNRIWRLEHQNSTSLSLVSALKFELDRACIHIHKLILEQKTSRSEIDILLKQFEEEKVLWKIKEQEKIHNAITSIAGELEIERKLRRQTERLNKKLGKELSETKESLSKVTKELESEKRAREILEQACDELARGIGEDRAEVEEMKRQSEKALEEVEKEREMLQLADVLREERVQMKLSEAKYQFEEKNAVLDKLRDELEAYLKSKTGEEEERGDVDSPSYDKIKELEKYLKETLPGPGSGSGSYQYRDKERENNDDEEEEDDSDLHSIELNVDDINKNVFQWSDGVKNGSKRNSVDRSKGRKSIEKVNKTSEAKFTDGVEWEFTANNKKERHLDVFEFTSQYSWKKDVEDEMERYNMIKGLRDHIVSASRVAPSQDSDSPGKKFGQKSVIAKDPNEVICQG